MADADWSRNFDCTLCGTATWYGDYGKFFGPITLVWFISIGLLGLWSIIQTPHILLFVNPLWAIEFAIHQPFIAFIAMGSVVLTMTGGEALYADLWGILVVCLFGWHGLLCCPCLLLNYAGQGALLLRDPAAVSNPFLFIGTRMGFIPDDWFGYSCCGNCASQAVITGVFSMVNQAIQLRYLPRLSVIHTSDVEQGQIYVPFINWVLYISVFYFNYFI